ncbi:MAG: methyltransferase domain-containing protein, partial [Clostridia bacterium]|nr:methyltransferase domain-containing protein [Clostridia bacterium]
MKNIIGINITRARKACGLTQEALGEMLHVSPQSVSKWETGTTQPDVMTLAQIAAITQTSVDALAGYPHDISAQTPYQTWYDTDEYYWGFAPSSLCLEIVRLCPPVRPLRVLDIGCGEGKDAVFLARLGYRVSAFDLAVSGVEKTKRLAAQAGVPVDVFRADLNDYRPTETFDILYSSGTLHYLRPELRGEVFESYKNHIADGGLAAMNVFVAKPFLLPPPEKETAWLWKSGELFTLLHD